VVISALEVTGVVRLVRLRALRERQALSQAELAEQAGITRTALSRIEAGAAEPRPSTIRRLAAALKVLPSALMGPETEAAAEAQK
jgi:XRE family transcriptional regulator, regulator of sulfur utilization